MHCKLLCSEVKAAMPYLPALAQVLAGTADSKVARAAGKKYSLALVGQALVELRHSYDSAQPIVPCPA